MAPSKGRGPKNSKPSKGSTKHAAKIDGSDKDQHRAAEHGRAEQGLGSAGRPGGTKSAGGHGGFGARKGGQRGQGGQRSGGGAR
jgi:hypothetical protein